MKNKMKVIEAKSPGGPEVLQMSERARPSPRANEVLIQVHYAGINRADLSQRKGTYNPPPGASDLMGLEVSGEIIELGEEVQDWKKGDRVCALVSGGGYAEYCVAHYGQVLPIPKKMDLKEAAALPESLFTVWSNVFERGKLKSGESFLVHGGTSGIGMFAIPLAKAFGAKVFTTAGTPEKVQSCLDWGADVAIQYTQKDFAQEILANTSGQGVDLILDMIGAKYLSRNIEVLAKNGRLVMISIQGGAIAEIDLWKIMSKRLTLTGSTLRPQTDLEKLQIGKSLIQKVWPLLDSGQLKPVIDSVFEMSQVGAAHLKLEGHTHIGKILIKVNS